MLRLQDAGTYPDAFGAIAVQLAFPILRPAIEEQVRRAVVTVHWQEGQVERHFNVVQFLVADQNTHAPVWPGPVCPGAFWPGTTGAPGAWVF